MNKTTREMASDVVATALLSPILDGDKFTNAEQIKQRARREFTKCMTRGEYSYDPNDGEVIVSFTEATGLNMLANFDNTKVGHIVKEAFVEDGWESVIVLPRNSGNNRALLKLRDAGFKSGKLLPNNIRGSK